MSYLIPCSSASDVQAALDRLGAEHRSATHIAFAFRIKTESGILSRMSDAGEPGGTAGKPIYLHLEGRRLINCLLAVVRYFGGIKLGARGLTRACGNAARQAIESNTLVPFVEYRKISVTIDYPKLHDLEYYLKNWEETIESRSYGEGIEPVVSLPEPSVPEFEKLVAVQSG
ncbi:MAG: IMPACT family protein [Methylococcales bacterium]